MIAQTELHSPQHYTAQHYTQQAFTRVNEMEKCQHNQQEDATFLLTVNCKKIRLRNVTL